MHHSGLSESRGGEGGAFSPSSRFAGGWDDLSKVVKVHSFEQCLPAQKWGLRDPVSISLHSCLPVTGHETLVGQARFAWYLVCLRAGLVLDSVSTPDHPNSGSRKIPL